MATMPEIYGDEPMTDENKKGAATEDPATKQEFSFDTNPDPEEIATWEITDTETLKTAQLMIWTESQALGRVLGLLQDGLIEVFYDPTEEEGVYNQKEGLSDYEKGKSEGIKACTEYTGLLYEKSYKRYDAITTLLNKRQGGGEIQH
jgi:hypothetical protein